MVESKAKADKYLNSLFCLTILLEPSLLNYQFLHFDISQEAYSYFMKCTFLQKPAILVSTAQHLVNLTAIHSSPCVAVDVNLNT